MLFFLSNFIKDHVYISPLDTGLPQFRHGMKEAIASIIPDLLTEVGKILLQIQ